MSNRQIYLALYKGRRDGTGAQVWAARFTDGLTRILTRGRYSHCEIAIRLDGQNSEPQYECYSASLRDKGVRMKTMPLPSEKWDLIALPDVAGSLKANLAAVFARTQGQRYDLAGALGVVFKTRQRHERWFCSEWCGQVLGLSEPWRFSPNDLAAVAAALTVSGSLNEPETGSRA